MKRYTNCVKINQSSYPCNDHFIWRKVFADRYMMWECGVTFLRSNKFFKGMDWMDFKRLLKDKQDMVYGLYEEMKRYDVECIKNSGLTY